MIMHRCPNGTAPQNLAAPVFQSLQLPQCSISVPPQVISWWYRPNGCVLVDLSGIIFCFQSDDVDDVELTSETFAWSCLHCRHLWTFNKDTFLFRVLVFTAH